MLDFHGLNGDLPAGRWSPNRYQQIRSLRFGASLQIAWDAYLDQLDLFEQLQTRLKTALQALSRKARYHPAVQTKQSYAGVGWLSAIRFTLEWGAMTRFPSGKHLAGFTGLTSREFSTGETVRRGRITGTSPWQIRAWLVPCAWRAITT